MKWLRNFLRRRQLRRFPDQLVGSGAVRQADAPNVSDFNDALQRSLRTVEQDTDR